jgi:hypothetical protein
MGKYRIENIQKVKLNGRNVKLFKVFEYCEEQNAYVFIGQFEAPAKTANKNLHNYI